MNDSACDFGKGAKRKTITESVSKMWISMREIMGSKEAFKSIRIVRMGHSVKDVGKYVQRRIESRARMNRRREIGVGKEWWAQGKGGLKEQGGIGRPRRRPNVWSYCKKSRHGRGRQGGECKRMHHP